MLQSSEVMKRSEAEATDHAPLAAMTQFLGVVQRLRVPAQLRSSDDGRDFLAAEGALPIHRCPREEVEAWARKTHHFSGLFCDVTLAPLSELAYVRLDEDTVEKVFVNRARRVLVVSSDGVLAQWRCCPSFESRNRLQAGAPVVDGDGRLLSVLTARRDAHYALSNYEGDGGYFDTPQAWKTVRVPDGHSCYGDRSFATRDELRRHVEALPAASWGPSEPPTPVLLLARTPRVALVAHNGRQLAHLFLSGVSADGVEYL